MRHQLGCRYTYLLLLAIGLALVLSGIVYASTNRSQAASATRTPRKDHGRKATAVGETCPPSSAAKAYGYVLGRAILAPQSASACRIPGSHPPRAYVLPSYYNAVEEQPNIGSPSGAYCFRAAHGVIPGDSIGGVQPVVVINVAGPQYSSTPSARDGVTAERIATWMPEASHCPQRDFEVQTWEVTVGPSGFVQTSSPYVDFTFMIP